MNNKIMQNDRDGFMSYNMASFPYMGMPMMPITMDNNSCQNNIEKRISNLENRVSKLENNMYPKAIDNTNGYTYQSSLNIM